MIEEMQDRLNYEYLEKISKEHGDSFYFLHLNKFKKNYQQFLKSFTEVYKNSQIAYSYKTNYIPEICKIVDSLGGYAEIVSSMELKLAHSIGVDNKNIIFNGPYKDKESLKKVLLGGGIVNIDSQEEYKIIKEISRIENNNELKLAIRCNFEIEDLSSRFGFDVKSKEFNNLVNDINSTDKLVLGGLHCHFPNRNLQSYKTRIKTMIELTEFIFKDKAPEFINIGGGYFGNMDEKLKNQFEIEVPTYKDYGRIIASHLKSSYKKDRPKLILEPGSALVADCMEFFSKVISLKEVRGRKIATVAGSNFNTSPTSKETNLPMKVYAKNKRNTYSRDNIDVGGYTCIETDYLQKKFIGDIEVGDFIGLENVGSYSVVMKPPFILPNRTILGVEEDLNDLIVIKREETFEDIFNTFNL